MENFVFLVNVNWIRTLKTNFLRPKVFAISPYMFKLIRPNKKDRVLKILNGDSADFTITSKVQISQVYQTINC